MCLILLSLKAHPVYKLVFAANRDEYFDRPTVPAHFWDEAPGLLAGKDLKAGGTWMGITKEGRLAAITNYRDPTSINEMAPSRGKLVTDYLCGHETPEDYLANLVHKGNSYNGFNLLVGQEDRLFWYSNRSNGPRELTPGIHGLSNAVLDTPWPKVSGGRNALARLLTCSEKPAEESLFRILSDRSRADDDKLPDTGVGLGWERTLSPIFITSPFYGTRSSTLLLIDTDNRVTFIERTFDKDPDSPETIKFEFRIGP